MTVTVEPTVLMFAFRYALGRRSYAPGLVRDAITANLDALSPATRLQMVHEIHRAVELGEAGMSFDVEEWSRFAEDLLRTLPKEES